MDNLGAPSQIQEAEYEFPYHWIPTLSARRWSSVRRLEWGFEYLAVLTSVADSVHALAPDSVLDFGCGDGRLACLLAKSGVREVVGVDTSERAIAFARAFATGEHLAPTFLCEDVNQIEGVGDFSVCVAMEVLEHVPPLDIPPIVNRLHQLTADGGALVVSVPTKCRPIHPKHFRHYDTSQLVSELLPFFRLEHAVYVHAGRPLAKLLRRINHNRLVDVSNHTVLGWTTAIYRQFVLTSSPKHGTHIVATFRKNRVG